MKILHKIFVLINNYIINILAVISLNMKGNMHCNEFDRDFWISIDSMVGSSEIIIDRPKSSRHPVYGNIIYPLDYGYLKNTKSKDGNEIDVWKGTGSQGRVDAVLCTVDLLKNDSEIKLLYSCTDSEKEIIYRFQNEKYMKAILINRHDSVIV
jgi:inorganic pyrophosphatase